ncbi:MAG: hypothetical protein V4676_11400 [Bacteroidota bacterium]
MRHNNLRIVKKSMQLKLAMFLLVIAFVACNNPVITTETTTRATNAPTKPETSDPEENNKPNDKDVSTNDEAGTNCYVQVLARDTFVAHLRLNGNIVTGKLSFDNFEKDGSTGTVRGFREDDVLKLLYTFQSEGSTSKMDVYYKLTDEGLVRGVGEMDVRNDTTYFKNAKEVKYTKEHNLLKKVDCNSVPAKYR